MSEPNGSPPGTNAKCPRCGFVTSNVFACPTCAGTVDLNAAPEPAELQRYAQAPTRDGCHMERCDDGDWCLYSDAAAKIAHSEVNRLHAEQCAADWLKRAEQAEKNYSDAYKDFQYADSDYQQAEERACGLELVNGLQAQSITDLAGKLKRAEDRVRQVQDFADGQGIRAGLAETSLAQTDERVQELEAALARISNLKHNTHAAFRDDLAVTIADAALLARKGEG